MAQAQNQDKKSNSRKVLIIVFVVLLLGINGIQLFFNLKQNEEIGQKQVMIDDQKKKIDSIGVELKGTIDSLNAKKAQIAKLGGDTTALGEKIREMEAAVLKLKKSNNYNYSEFKKYKQLYEDAKGQMLTAQADVDKYKALVEAQQGQITSLKGDINTKDEQISTLNQDKKDLSQKVAIASVLKAENFKVQAVSTKGKAKEGTSFKAKTIDELKINFNLAENKVADKGPRDVYMQVIEPDGSVLVNTETGGGKFTANGKESMYTMKTSVTYMNSNQNVGFTYKKGNPYKPGKHRVEIYCEGVMIGESSFDVLK